MTAVAELDAVQITALRALEGMAEVVRNEMLAQGRYVRHLTRPDLAASGAICGGHQACAIGALWMGAGIKPRRDVWGEWMLEGADDSSNRDVFLEDRPGLRLAYNALNDAADRYVHDHDLSPTASFSSSMERLFESLDAHGYPLIDAHEVFPDLIADAAERILRDDVEL